MFYHKIFSKTFSPFQIPEEEKGFRLSMLKLGPILPRQKKKTNEELRCAESILSCRPLLT